MTLRVPKPTEASVETVRLHLSALAGRTAFRERSLTRADPAGLALAAPHDVYSLGLRGLAEGASLEAATAVGRRFLVMDGDKPVASAELADDEGSGFQVNEGPLVESTAAAIEHAETDPELGGSDYEVRVLRVPGLYFTALWLKNEQDGADVVIPLQPAPAPFMAGRKYAPVEIRSLLAEAARARLAYDDEDEASP
jgi:hypothetical protein